MISERATSDLNEVCFQRCSSTTLQEHTVDRHSAQLNSVSRLIQVGLSLLTLGSDLVLQGPKVGAWQNCQARVRWRSNQNHYTRMWSTLLSGRESKLYPLTFSHVFCNASRLCWSRFSIVVSILALSFVTITRFFCRAPSRFSRLFNAIERQFKFEKQEHISVPLNHIHHLQIHLLFIRLLHFLEGGCMCLKRVNISLIKIILCVWFAEQTVQQQGKWRVKIKMTKTGKSGFTHCLSCLIHSYCFSYDSILFWAVTVSFCRTWTLWSSFSTSISQFDTVALRALMTSSRDFSSASKRLRVACSSRSLCSASW